MTTATASSEEIEILVRVSVRSECEFMSEFIKHTPGALCSSGEWRVAFDHVRRGRVQGLKVPYKRIHLNRVMSKRTKRAVRKVAVFWILDFGFWLQKMFADPHTTRHAARSAPSPKQAHRDVATGNSSSSQANEIFVNFCQAPSTFAVCRSLSHLSLSFSFPAPCYLLVHHVLSSLICSSFVSFRYLLFLISLPRAKSSSS
jgi:hypothetical protein